MLFVVIVDIFTILYQHDGVLENQNGSAIFIEKLKMLSMVINFQEYGHYCQNYLLITLMPGNIQIKIMFLDNQVRYSEDDTSLFLR